MAKAGKSLKASGKTNSSPRGVVWLLPKSTKYTVTSPSENTHIQRTDTLITSKHTHTKETRKLISSQTRITVNTAVFHSLRFMHVSAATQTSQYNISGFIYTKTQNKTYFMPRYAIKHKITGIIYTKRHKKCAIN
jgi:hypothetical protein